MDARRAGPVVLLVLLVGCGSSRTDREATVRTAAGSGTDAGSCPIEVVNQTRFPLILRQAVPGLRSSVIVGEVEGHGTFRFTTSCDVETVRITGLAGRSVTSDHVAWGGARLREGELTRVELDRRAGFFESGDEGRRDGT